MRNKRLSNRSILTDQVLKPTYFVPNKIKFCKTIDRVREGESISLPWVFFDTLSCGLDKYVVLFDLSDKKQYKFKLSKVCSLE